MGAAKLSGVAGRARQHSSDRHTAAQPLTTSTRLTFTLARRRRGAGLPGREGYFQPPQPRRLQNICLECKAGYF